MPIPDFGLLRPPVIRRGAGRTHQQWRSQGDAVVTGGVTFEGRRHPA